MVSNHIRSLNKPVKRCVTYNKIFLQVKDTKTFTLIENILSGEKKSAKTNLKAACSWISHDRNSVELQF